MSYQKGKTDPVLGKEVDNYLRQKGVHTPVCEPYLDVSDDTKIKILSGIFVILCRC